MKKIIALTIALSAAAGANAAWDYGTSYGADGVKGFNEDGELVFFLFDENINNLVSGAQDLGIRYNTMRANAGDASFTQTFALDTSVFGNFDSIADKSSLRWGVMAFSQGFLDLDYGMMTTSSVANPYAIANEINNALNSFPVFVSKINVSGDTDFADNNATWGTESNGRYLGANSALGRQLSQSQYFDTTAGIEGALSFHLWTDDFSQENTIRTDFAGLWTMDLANKTVTYNAQSTPEVPVPAAAWLMGSALVGLTGVARRRNHK